MNSNEDDFELNMRALLNAKRDSILLLYGGSASGKTTTAIEWIVNTAALAMQAGLPFSARICRFKYKLAKKLFETAVRFIEDSGFMDFGVTIRLSPHLHIIFAKNVEISFENAENWEDIKNEEQDVWLLDEANAIPIEFYEQTLLRHPRDTDFRKRYLDGYRIILTWNPEHSGIWPIRTFFEVNNPNQPKELPYDEIKQPYHIDFIKSTYKNNKFVDKATVALLKSYEFTSKRKFNVYTCGNCGTIDELIFQNVEEIGDREFAMHPITRKYDAIGMDFGIKNPTAIVGVWFDGNTIIADEIFYEIGKPKMEVCIWCGRNPNLHDIPFFCDPADPDAINTLQRCGLAYATKADNNVLHGIAYLQNFELLLTPRSTNLAKELAQYEWEKDADGNLKEKPIKINDHAIDALRYAVYSYHVNGYDGKKSTFTGYCG